MAITVAPFQSQDLTDFEDAMNVALAALTDPTIRGLDINIWVDQRRTGMDLRALLTTESGGASLATPFILKLFFGTNLTDVSDAVQTFLTANPSYFTTGLRLLFADVGHREPQYVAWLLYNVTAGASANYLPL